MNPSDKYEQIKHIKHLNPVEQEAMVLKHEQQIKDIAAHLLELKQRVTPMMEFKRSGWVGLTDDEMETLYYGNADTITGMERNFGRAVEAKLKEKNGG
jgi:hypothetical protein